MTVLDTFSLADKVAVVTGGAGLYGRQIVDALAEAGADTVIASRNVETLNQVATQLTARSLAVTTAPLDLTDEASIRNFCRQTIDRHGRIDILVNNAVLRPMSPGKFDPAAWRESMQANASGLYIISELTAEQMKPRRSGSIINIASIQGMVGIDTTIYEDLPLDGHIPDYFFHKGGMINYTRYLAGALGPYNIRVNSISPGGLLADQPQRFVDRYSARTMLGRMANSTDMKGAVTFLACDASAYITGVNLPVDGGYTAK